MDESFEKWFKERFCEEWNEQIQRDFVEQNIKEAFKAGWQASREQQIHDDDEKLS